MNVKKVSDFVGSRWKDKKIIYAAIAAVVLLAAGVYWYNQTRTAYVPQEFYASRDRAAEISTRIVQLTDASVVTLGQISVADEKGDYKRGLELVSQEIDRNAEIKSQTFKLSEELKIMLLNLGVVKPDKAAEAGLRATTNGLELAQKMVNYNNLAQELLVQLQTRLKKNGSPETRQRIEQIILRMNEEAAAINDLNKQYQDRMKEFDRLTSR